MKIGAKIRRIIDTGKKIQEKFQHYFIELLYFLALSFLFYFIS